MLAEHEHEVDRLVDKLLHDGLATVASWEQMRWYGLCSDNVMYADIQSRYHKLFEKKFGDADEAYIHVLRRDGKISFINDEKVIRLDLLIN